MRRTEPAWLHVPQMVLNIELRSESDSELEDLCCGSDQDSAEPTHVLRQSTFVVGPRPVRLCCDLGWSMLSVAFQAAVCKLVCCVTCANVTLLNFTSSCGSLIDNNVEQSMQSFQSFLAYSQAPSLASKCTLETTSEAAPVDWIHAPHIRHTLLLAPLFQGKKRRNVGRPITYRGDPNSKALTEVERRKIKRRIANRESARRVRAKRAETLDELQVKVSVSLQRDVVRADSDSKLPQAQKPSLHLLYCPASVTCVCMF